MNTLSPAFKNITTFPDVLFRVVQDSTLEHMLNHEGFEANVFVRLQDLGLSSSEAANDSAAIARMVMKGHYSTDLTVSVFGSIQPVPYRMP